MEINSSLIKEFLSHGEYKNYCARYIKEVRIDKKYKDEPSLAQLKGLFFETLCLGGCAKGQSVTDLPRKSLSKSKQLENDILIKEGKKPIHIGEKTTDQKRIEDQHLVFKQICSKFQININEFNTQIVIRKKFDAIPGVTLKGELDIFPTTILTSDGLVLACIDLKSTGNINNTFGDYGWGEPEKMDHIQADLYNYLIRDIDLKLNPHLKDIVFKSVLNLISENLVRFYYLVFDYKPKSEWKPVIRNWDKLKERELFESIRKTHSVIVKHNKTEWEENYTCGLCKTCPIVDCKGKVYVEEI